MEHIVTNSEIYGIICKVLDGLDETILKRGEQTSYTLIHMLEVEGRFSEQERIKFGMVALLQELSLMKYGRKNSDNWLEYSIFSYLFLKYLSPVGDLAEIIQYHDMEYHVQKKFHSKYPKVCEYLCVADDAVDFIPYYNEGHSIEFVMQKTNYKYSKEALELLWKAEKEHSIFKEIKDKDFHSFVVKDVSRMILGQEDIKKVLEMLIYLIDLKSRQTSLHSFKVAELAMEIGHQMLLGHEEIEKLYYGALLHDIGKVKIPNIILEAPRGLTQEEMQIMKSHVVQSELILDGVVNEEIKLIAIRHHEKLDGSGYPHGVMGERLTQLERIMAVADILSALTENRSYKVSYTKIKIKNILKAEMKQGKICPIVTEVVLQNYSEIVNNVSRKMEIMKKQYELMMVEKEYVYLKLHKNYEKYKSCL